MMKAMTTVPATKTAALMSYLPKNARNNPSTMKIAPKTLAYLSIHYMNALYEKTGQAMLLTKVVSYCVPFDPPTGTRGPETRFGY